MNCFKLNRATEIVCRQELSGRPPVERSIKRLKRDVRATVASEGTCGGKIIIAAKEMDAESWHISVTETELAVEAADELGAVYALLFISGEWLGIKPLWFWNDQKIKMQEIAEIPCGVYESKKARVLLRGWFLNDEVLLKNWTAGVDNAHAWEMAFEALLRLGGNLVIAGTDKTTKICTPLAVEMGLMITHHHAEPLGAEMFARAYPELEASYQKYPELYKKLWEEAIVRQKGQRTVFNLGFRGQGDRPFWEDDESFDTDEKRGELIGDLIRLQRDMVKKEIPDALFCTNLYGEVMELYRAGHVKIPEDVILLWADNGYGKMVSRRQGSRNPRVPALPDEAQQKNRHGTYYHASFYDLQAANHITQLPNPMEFVERELNGAYERGVRTLWIINASNVKPHVYTLDFIANLWGGSPVTAAEHRMQYIKTYYAGETATEKELEKMAACFARYAGAAVAYGQHEDERAGEQFANYVARDIIHQWMIDDKAPAKALSWCASYATLAEQVHWFAGKCRQGQEGFGGLLEECEALAEAGGRLWEDSLLLQVRLQKYCYDGATLLCAAFSAYEKERYMEAFVLLGRAAEAFDAANKSMRDCEHDKWKDFYANECLCDVKETAYCLRRLMGYVRNIGDGPDFFFWQRKVLCSKEDRRVLLITNMDNHMTDWELYLGLKERHE